MTYAGLFEKCRTVGEARRMKVTFLSRIKDDDEISRLEIESEYKNRVWEIMQEGRVFWVNQVI